MILDCCYSGSIVDRTTCDEHLREDSMPKSEKVDRISIFSTRPNEPAFESSELRNGDFTHKIIRGLKGEAVETATGEVTLNSLLAYLQGEMEAPNSIYWGGAYTQPACLDATWSDARPFV